jgi:hypothetical protein
MKHSIFIGTICFAILQYTHGFLSSVSFHPPKYAGSSTDLFLSKTTMSVYLEPKLTDDRIKSLFAWVSQAFAGRQEYDNLMLAFCAVFGTNVPESSEPMIMLRHAEELLGDDEEKLRGARISRTQREQASLGAMGAGQWTGQWTTRPHALLQVKNMTDINDWISTLPRGCKRTLKKANAENFTVSSYPILSNEPAPHSSLSHFRCVVQHEVRLIVDGEDDIQGFFDALAEAVSRYIGTTRMTGVIQEYRNEEGKVIAFAHEVRKARTIRGQWFYCDDEASKKYVWFHSVQELVRRAIESDGVDTVDLGPSGSDAFSELKARYGFESIEDWPQYADYTSGGFYYEGEDNETSDEQERLMALLRMLGGQ